MLIDVLRNFDYSRYDVDLCLINKGGILMGEIPEGVKTFWLWDGYTPGYKAAYRLSLRWGWHWPLRRKLRRIKTDYNVAISFLEGMPLRMHSLMDTGRAVDATWVHCDLLRFPYEVSQFRPGEELRAYNRMDHIVCVAADTAKAFRERFEGCTAPVEVIYNPIDSAKILRMAEEAQVSYTRPTVAIVGRLTPPKKPLRVVSLAARLKAAGRSDVNLLMIGRGELQAELEAAIEEQGVGDMVELVGFKSNPFPMIKAADMLLSCSGFEGFSLVICEAMLLGVPVVSTRTAGPLELLDNDEYGLLCDHDDESIFNAVCRMLDSADLRRHYAARGKERVKEFEASRCLEQIYKLAESNEA